MHSPARDRTSNLLVKESGSLPLIYRPVPVYYAQCTHVSLGEKRKEKKAVSCSLHGLLI